MPRHSLDIEGNKYGLFTVLWRATSGFRNFVCVCSCGEIKEVSMYYLKRADGNKSCGCARVLKNKERSTHGLGNHQLKSTYFNMLRRCNNDKDLHYKDYGGRGISVCPRWSCQINGISNFVEDMGEEPNPKYTLDRIDNNGDYRPENCKWSSQLEQTNNTRKNVHFEMGGIIYTMAQLSRLLGITRYHLQEGKIGNKQLPIGVKAI